MDQTLPLLALATLIGFAAALWPLRAFLKATAGRHSNAALIAATVVVAGALGLYLVTGKPAMADAPFAARIAALEDTAKTTPQALNNEEMLAILDARSRRTPDEPQAYYFSGVIYASEGRFEEAARAFDAALRRDPQNPAVMIELGAAMVAMNGREVTPEAHTLFVEAEKLKPGDVRPVFYQALYASQTGDKTTARALWPRVKAMLDKDDPRQRMATMMLEQARS